EDDVLILAGDLSWAGNLRDALPDLERVGAMKGRKILIKGNHDYWWETKSKLKRFLHPSIQLVQTQSVIVERIAMAGTRGWVCPGSELFQAEDEKIYIREVGRLKLALESLRGREKEYDHLVVALHYPPTNENRAPSGFTELIGEHGAGICLFGHLHGESTRLAITGLHGKTTYHLCSADYVDFCPVRVI
ncbi:MAG: metallophosphoesterase, partial [Blastocatellia bacterium]